MLRKILTDIFINASNIKNENVIKIFR